MKINTTQDLDKCLATLGYSESGGYPLYFVTDGGDCLSFASVASYEGKAKDAVEFGLSNGWRVIACLVNWDAEIYCSHSGERIEAANGSKD